MIKDVLPADITAWLGSLSVLKHDNGIVSAS
jgi:hypothetical protein